MAEIKVSQLPEASAINDEDLLMIVQGGTNKKITKENCQFASGDEVSIGTTEPSEEEKLWINPEETPSGSLNPITNEYSDAQDKAYSCHYVNNSDSYSTSEIKTNKTWIDGKPIYRKVLLASKSDFSSNNHLYAIPNSVSNLENYTHIEARLKRTSDVWNEIPNGFGVTSANGWSVTMNDITKTSISIQIGENVYNYLETDNSVIVIIEYTKITD